MSHDAAHHDHEPLPALGATAPSRRERLGLRLDPEHVFAEVFAGERRAFWLDAGIRSHGLSHLGAASTARPGYLVRGDRLWQLNADDTDPVELANGAGGLDAVLRSWRFSSHEDPADERVPIRPVDGSPLGWVGWFGYEHGARRLGVEAEASRYPDAVMLAADRVVTIDHATGESWLWFVDDADGRDWAVGMRRRLAGLEATASSRDGIPDTDRADGADVPTAGVPHWRHGDAEYLRMIGACQESIRAGDAYQLCLTNTATVQTPADPFTVYRRLRRSSNAAHGAYVRVDDVAVLCASPELFLSIADGVAVTRPVKGTRPRAASAARDARLRDELAVNEKERAENLMIVDLMRNDLGRVARIGGVSVTELLAVETHAHVHQLVSTVRADLAEATDALDVLAASFPAGSMTGAPKLSAMTLLHELERGPRGVYSGCLGRLGLDGRAELAMIIRTIVMSPGLATVGSGGGITALSVPDEELAEVKLKARALFEALGVPVATADGNLSDTSE